MMRRALLLALLALLLAPAPSPAYVSGIEKDLSYATQLWFYIPWKVKVHTICPRMSGYGFDCRTYWSERRNERCRLSWHVSRKWYETDEKVVCVDTRTRALRSRSRPPRSGPKKGKPVEWTSWHMPPVLGVEWLDKPEACYPIQITNPHAALYGVTDWLQCTPPEAHRGLR